MFDLGVLRELGTAVLGAAGVLALARAARVPPLVGYLVAGLLLGPAAGVLTVTGSLDLLAHLGVALLLFLVGLELSVDRVREVGRTAAIAGVGQMLATLLLGGALSLALGFSFPEALFLGLAVTFSSTVVVVKLLDEAADVAKRYGRISVGVLLVQDVGVALALTAVAGLSGAQGPAAAGRQLGLSLVGLLGLVALAAAAVRLGLGRALAWLSDLPEAAFVAALTWCLALMLAAERANLSVELGAFVAGVAVAQLPQAHDLHRRVRPLVDFLLAVFFVTLGAGLDLGAAAPHAGLLYEQLRGRRLLRLFGRPGGEDAETRRRRGHVVVVGMNALGRGLVRALSARGEEVVAVDTDPGKLEGLGTETLVGDVNLSRVLDELEIGRARLVVSALQIEDTNRLLVHRCHGLGVPVAVHAFDPGEADDLRELGADHLILSRREEARRLAALLGRAGGAVPR